MQGLGNRYSQHSFAQIPQVNMARSKFDRSFTVKDTFDFDYLVPVFCDEILPGDTANLSMTAFARLSSYALKAPVMDNMYIDFYFFFVPNRLVWDNWERFNGAQDNPGDSTDYVVPYLTMKTGGYDVGEIFDHFGLPTDVEYQGYTNALPFRGYNLIYNTWFRDQNLQNSVTVNKGNGPDAYTDYTLLKGAKAHDYFTSCLPWPQKGDAVELPLAGTLPVYGIGTMNQVFATNAGTVYESDGATGTYPYAKQVWDGTNNNAVFVEGTSAAGGYPNIRVDLADATAVTINEFREAMMMQSLLELDARGGTRYVEILLAHFNVVSPDFRLQRPEYLGGGRSYINSHVVPQTSPTSGSNAQGQVAAYATSSATGNRIGFTKSFVEHGFVIGLARARADVTYQQGLNRMWSRQTRWDYFWPKLQELGEQAVLNREIYAAGATDGDVFGYQERYAEYRYKPSEIRGQFRSTYATTLDYWHLAEEFGSLPALNSTFIQSNTPIERALAVTTGPDLLMDMWFSYKHARPMLTYSVPATLGRF